jgi:YD repeat-containing protein
VLVVGIVSILALLTAATAFFVMPRPAEYYYLLGQDGRDQFVGRVPVPKKLVNKVNCYHVIRGEGGRVERIEHLRNGKLLPDTGGPLGGAAQVQVEFSDGYQKFTYLDSAGFPTAGLLGVFASRLRLDSAGNPTARFNYNNKGELAPDSKGVVQYQWTLDGKGRRIQSIRLDAAGARIADSDGITRVERKYDEKGWVSEWSQFKEDDSLLYTTKIVYDSVGNEIAVSFTGGDGQLIAPWGGYAIVRQSFDARGYFIERRFFGTDVQPVAESDSGAFAFQWACDEQGNTTETRYIGKDGQPTAHKENGVAITRWVYDGDGNKLSEESFDVAGKRVAKRLGIATTRWKYDDKGKVIGEAFFDVDGKPVGKSE